MAVAAQVEQDDPRLARLLGRPCLVDRDPDGVARFGRGQDALGSGEGDASFEAQRWWTLRASMKSCSLRRLTSGAMPW